MSMQPEEVNAPQRSHKGSPICPMDPAVASQKVFGSILVGIGIVIRIIAINTSYIYIYILI